MLKQRLCFIKRTKNGGFDKNLNKQVKAMALYRCECGKIVECQIANVMNLHTTSCGCYRKAVFVNKKHGFSKHPLYSARLNMISRCYNPKDIGYANYGAIGVIVCDEWLKNVMSFIKWALDNGWVKGLQIDKDIIPKRLGVPATIYSPQMCSIVTPLENQNNRKDNMRVEYNGMVKTLSEWERFSGISQDVLWQRIKKYRWSVVDAFTKPVRIVKDYSKYEKIILESNLSTRKLCIQYGLTRKVVDGIRRDKQKCLQ